MKRVAVIGGVALAATGMIAGSLGRVAAQEKNAVASSVIPEMNKENIRAHVRFLSHDLLEGRGTGQRGGDIAAEYIAAQFALYGLKSAGDGGTYFQNVPMVEVKTLPETSFQFSEPGGKSFTAKNLEDFVTNNESQTETADIDAPVVFLGYGIKAPEYNWDDYKSVDLHGKVALVFVNEPSSDDPKFFKGKALTYYGRWTYKFEETARRGAIATLIIHRPDLASYGWEVVRNSWGSQRSYLKTDGTPKLQAASWVQWKVADRLLGIVGMDLDKLYQRAQSREFQPLTLPVHLKAHVASALRPFVSRNVLGMLPGSAPGLRDEAVMYTAHYDHLGIDPAMKGDNIYNGANDNATGCGILLELARAWSGVLVPPPRSILFASVTAEEQGLLGSEYLGKHSPVPPGKISVDLNFDDVPPLGDPEEVEVSGAERTTFYPVVTATATEFRYVIRPDPRPEAGHYYRSDHFSLARAGVPAFSINEGIKFKGHDAAWGEAQAKDYVAHRYHQPSDEYEPEMDFTGDAAIAKFGFALGLRAAVAPQLATWMPGDEFEPARKKSQSTATAAIRPEALHYPPLARQVRVQGEVNLAVMIDETGKVLTAKIISGHPLLMEAAVKNVLSWSFKDIVSCPASLEITYHFVLRDKEEDDGNEKVAFDMPRSARVIVSQFPINPSFSEMAAKRAR